MHYRFNWKYFSSIYFFTFSVRPCVPSRTALNKASAAPLLARLRLAAVLGTRAYPAGFVAGFGSYRALLTGGALGKPASRVSATPRMLCAIRSVKGV